MNKKDYDNVMSSFKLIMGLANDATYDNRTLTMHRLVVERALKLLLDKEVNNEQDNRITKKDEGSQS